MSYSSFFYIAKDFKVIMLDSYGVLKNHKGLIEGVEKPLIGLNLRKNPLSY